MTVRKGPKKRKLSPRPSEMCFLQNDTADASTLRDQVPFNARDTLEEDHSSTLQKGNGHEKNTIAIVKSRQAREAKTRNLKDARYSPPSALTTADGNCANIMHLNAIQLLLIIFQDLSLELFWGSEFVTIHWSLPTTNRLRTTINIVCELHSGKASSFVVREVTCIRS